MANYVLKFSNKLNSVEELHHIVQIAPEKIGKWGEGKLCAY